jgi:hypothetical protein
VTLAVRPAEVDAFPDVYTDLGISLLTYFKNYDFAVEGSPTMQMLISPLRLIPSSVFLLIPLKSMRRIPFLISICPCTVGVMLDASLS